LSTLVEAVVPEDLTLTLNGARRSAQCDPDATLLQVLRGPFALAGPRFGCGLGACGACTVLIDDHPVTACDTPALSVAGSVVTTVEGLGATPAGQALQSAFIAEQAGQCGYCLSGILVRSAALIARQPDLDERTVRETLERNLCRCGAHNRIVRAVLRAAGSGGEA
jgi:nicotinate dehydrogenase subunit A